MMYLKHSRKLSYETLVKEVSSSIAWRIFCRIPLDREVPDRSTLIKLTRRFGPEVIKALLDLLVQKGIEEKLIRGRKVRVDATVVQSPIKHPTDIGLLADGVRMVTRIVKRLQEVGVGAQTKFRDRTRTIKKVVRAVGYALRGKAREAREALRQQTMRALDITKQVVYQAERILLESRARVEKIRGCAADAGKQLWQELHHTLNLVTRVMAQTVLDLAGVRSIPDRIVSLFDPESEAHLPGQGQPEDRIWLQSGAHRDRGADHHPFRSLLRQPRR